MRRLLSFAPAVATTRSARPSWSKSAAAVATGASPTGNERGASAKEALEHGVPEEFWITSPSRSVEYEVAKSTRPSAAKSPIARPRGAEDGSSAAL